MTQQNKTKHKIIGRKVIKTNQWQYHPQGSNSSIWCVRALNTQNRYPQNGKSPPSMNPTQHLSKALVPLSTQSACHPLHKAGGLIFAKPSIEKHSNVKWECRVTQASAYLFFFSTSAFNEILLGVWYKYNWASISTTQI